MNRILVVDDEESIRWVLKKGLTRKGYEIHTAENSSEALEKIKKNSYSLAFFDLIMPGESGLDLLCEAKKLDNEIVVVIMTAQDTMTNAISAMQKGAYDYIAKPFDFDEIYLLVDRAFELQQLKSAVSGLRAQIQERDDEGEIIGKSKKIREVFKIIGRVAPTDVSILITGESGTGKELVARAIHKNSRNLLGPFIAVNCAAIPRELMESEMFGHEKGAFSGAHESRAGKLELAKEGTLFLDEIGDMDFELQSKILRALQEKEFSRVGGDRLLPFRARVVSATNQDLEKEIKEKRFREDLFHRLNVVRIDMPPLRERSRDIPLLVNYFLAQPSGKDDLSGKEGEKKERVITGDALNCLKNYEWRGNIRELENVIRRAIALAPEGTITVEHLPAHIRGSTCSAAESTKEMLGTVVKQMIAAERQADGRTLYEDIVQEVERLLIQAVLSDTGGNKVKAAQILGINRNTISRKLKELS